MRIIALVGPSGTGKSHRAALVADQLEAQAIIDDGLLIMGNQIAAGSSAKRQRTRVGAIKAALFMEENRAQELKKALERLKPDSILILGTSLNMVNRIASRLDLPPPQQVFTIEDYASKREINTARFYRNHYNKHVIPAPTMEVKKSLPGIFVDSLHVFIRKKEAPGKKSWLEQSVIRPTFTSLGKLTIADNAIIAIASFAAQSVAGLASTGRITVNILQEGIIAIDMSPTVIYGYPVHRVAHKLQVEVYSTVEKLTGLQVNKVNVSVKSLHVPDSTKPN